MRTLNEALEYLNYHSPDSESIPKHEAVNAAFQELMQKVWDAIPEGPGKTVAIRAVSAIANNGN